MPGTKSGVNSAARPVSPDLPVAGVLADVVAASRGGAVVLTAPPGSGKTTLVPAAVLDDIESPGRVVLLQPRRLAARAVAHRIAALRGSPLGAEVGYQVRFDAKVGRDTRLVVETTGIMLRRLLDDITLPGITAVVLDEFHERSLEMDLVLGLLVRLRETVRPDLRVVVMSATLAADPVAKLLGADDGKAGRAACPVIHAEGRVFPVEMRYLGHGDRRDLVELVSEAVPRALAGDIRPRARVPSRCGRDPAAARRPWGHSPSGTGTSCCRSLATCRRRPKTACSTTSAAGR